MPESEDQDPVTRVATTVDGALVAKLDIAREYLRSSLPPEEVEEALADLTLENVVDMAVEAFLGSAVRALLEEPPE